VTATHHLTQLNIGRAVAPLDDPRMVEFMARLDEINGLAERSRGFVWRLQGENGNNTDLRIDDDPRVIVNLTAWESIEDLFAFTYRSEHKAVFARRFEWFERWNGPSVVLWWQPRGTTPTVDDALRRLHHLAAHGPTEDAFTFKQHFPPPIAVDGRAGVRSAVERGTAGG
jgi:heme-degrading monooxygenase HmoA